MPGCNEQIHPFIFAIFEMTALGFFLQHWKVGKTSENWHILTNLSIILGLYNSIPIFYAFRAILIL